MKTMYKLWLGTLFTIFISFASLAQSANSKVVLYPVVDNESGASNSRADKILLDKLKRVVLDNGLADNGVGSRFVITAHPVILDQETTGNVPPKTVVSFTLTFYVGDALDGKLFGSYSVDLKGIGNDLDGALASGYKKFNPKDCPGLSAMIAQAKARIIDYYNENANAILTKAKAAAGSGNYGECYEMLLQIPEGCSSYQKAQDLLVEYRTGELDNENKKLLDNARAAWSASPDENGASRARSIMAGISCPSNTVRNGMTALSKEMASRLKAVNDAERAAEAKAEANAHAERIAAINGATKVAVAYASRPVYHIHRWGWW